MSRVIALLALLAQGALCQAQELGRLFFSPAERGALDARRSGKAEGAAPVAQAPPRIDGYVLRSGGRLTLWVDGKLERSRVESSTGNALDQAEVRELIGNDRSKRSR